MHEIPISADQLIQALMALAKDETVCVLDSCGVSHLGSHLLIAGILPVDVLEIGGLPAEETLLKLDELVGGDLATVFTLSYDFGQRLQSINEPHSTEPDIFAARFDCLVVHDYLSGKTFLTGNLDRLDPLEKRLVELETRASVLSEQDSNRTETRTSRPVSNFTKADYIDAVERIKESIRSGDTYQTNLTQQLTVQTTKSAGRVFMDIRRQHPAPFAAFIKRPSSTVISASPERFFKIGNGVITASPIKGTRPRGETRAEDAALRSELLASEKDRAENTMIVDLLRNDLGRVCEYGSVEVEKLCDLEEHPTLFHLVSTIRGTLRGDTKFSEIIKATFPCGSITGAPKIRTMEIINRLEPDPRGLSMGTIGVYVPNTMSNAGGQLGPDSLNWTLDIGLELSVAIRTMTIRDGEASFNVGGGVTIDSDPESEYDESLLKAKALLRALGAEDADQDPSHS